MSKIAPKPTPDPGNLRLPDLPDAAGESQATSPHSDSSAEQVAGLKSSQKDNGLGQGFKKPNTEGPSLRRPTAEIPTHEQRQVGQEPLTPMQEAAENFRALPLRAVGGYGSSMSFEELSTFVLNTQIAGQGLGKLIRENAASENLSQEDRQQLKAIADGLKEYTAGFGPKISKSVMADAEALIERLDTYSRRNSTFSSLCSGVWMLDTSSYFLTQIEEVKVREGAQPMVSVECSLGDRKLTSKGMPGVTSEGIPQEVETTIDDLLVVTQKHLDELGVSYTFDSEMSSLKILPDDTTALGRFSKGLNKNLDSEVVFAPKLNWSRRSRGAFHSEKKILFLSLDAVEKGEVTTVELHEARHAFFEKDAEQNGRRELFRGRVRRTSEQTKLTFNFKDQELLELARSGSEWLGRKTQNGVYEALAGKVKARALTLKQCCERQVQIYTSLDKKVEALQVALETESTDEREILGLSKEIHLDLKALHQTTQVAKDIEVPPESVPDISSFKTRWGSFFRFNG